MIQILLATYNGAKYLDEQLESLFKQTYKNWTLLVHDDGSIDETLKILRVYQSQYPDKISLIDDGVTFGNARDNFTHLLKASSNEYVMFCDQDDVWLPKKIEQTFNKMQALEQQYENRPIVVHSDLEVVDEALNTLAVSMFEYQGLNKSINSLEQILVKNSVTGCTMMMNRQAIVVSLPIEPSAIMHDWWIAAKVINSSGLVEWVDEPLIKYRQHAANSVGAKKNSVFNLIKRCFTYAFNQKIRAQVWRQAKCIKPELKRSSFFLKKIQVAIKNTF